MGSIFGDRCTSAGNEVLKCQLGVIQIKVGHQIWAEASNPKIRFSPPLVPIV